MRRSVFLSVFGGHLLIILLLSTALLLFVLGTTRTRYLSHLTEQLGRLSGAIALQVEPLLQESSRARLDSVIAVLADKTDARLTVILPDGRVLADSEEDASRMENHAARPEIMAAYRGETGSSLRYSRTVQQEMLYVAVPIRRGTETVGVMRTSLFISQVNRLLRDLGRNVFLVAAGLVVVALLMALAFARGLSRPVQSMVQAARRVGEGDLAVRVAPGGSGELAELAESFNEMVARLRSLVAEQTQGRESLAKIMDSIREGLVVLDRDGRVRSSNGSFNTIAGEKQVAGRHLWEVLREPALAGLLERVSRTQPNGDARVRVEARTYICSASFVESSGETVVTFHDVTEMERMAQVKRDLVVNASHELRTPLTAIKGFIETMEEPGTEENRRYLNIIARHTERLINIVQDLLLLAEVEDETTRLNLESVDVTGLVRDVLKVFERQFADKGIKLSVAADPGVKPVRADRFRLEQVFINLVDNALKYTDAGEVKVSVVQQNSWVRCEVADTGIGIAREQLDRVFERFYVTDKARSRQLGGTGLGLSIVKHIVLLHGGKVEIQSEPGFGTTVLVLLPA